MRRVHVVTYIPRFVYLITGYKDLKKSWKSWLSDKKQWMLKIPKTAKILQTIEKILNGKLVPYNLFPHNSVPIMKVFLQRVRISRVANYCTLSRRESRLLLYIRLVGEPCPKSSILSTKLRVFQTIAKTIFKIWKKMKIQERNFCLIWIRIKMSNIKFQ